MAEQVAVFVHGKNIAQVARTGMKIAIPPFPHRTRKGWGNRCGQERPGPATPDWEGWRLRIEGLGSIGNL
jgi:hypothetical protein